VNCLQSVSSKAEKTEKAGSRESEDLVSGGSGNVAGGGGSRDSSGGGADRVAWGSRGSGAVNVVWGLAWGGSGARAAAVDSDWVGDRVCARDCQSLRSRGRVGRTADANGGSVWAVGGVVSNNVGGVRDGVVGASSNNGCSESEDSGSRELHLDGLFGIKLL